MKQIILILITLTLFINNPLSANEIIFNKNLPSLNKEENALIKNYTNLFFGKILNSKDYNIPSSDNENSIKLELINSYLNFDKWDVVNSERNFLERLSFSFLTGYTKFSSLNFYIYKDLLGFDPDGFEKTLQKLIKDKSLSYYFDNIIKIKPDYEIAFQLATINSKYFNKAYDLLGILYGYGLGRDLDLNKAYSYFNKSFDYGNFYAENLKNLLCQSIIRRNSVSIIVDGYVGPNSLKSMNEFLKKNNLTSKVFNNQNYLIDHEHVFSKVCEQDVFVDFAHNLLQNISRNIRSTKFKKELVENDLKLNSKNNKNFNKDKIKKNEKSLRAVNPTEMSQEDKVLCYRATDQIKSNISWSTNIYRQGSVHQAKDKGLSCGVNVDLTKDRSGKPVNEKIVWCVAKYFFPDIEYFPYWTSSTCVSDDDKVISEIEVVKKIKTINSFKNRYCDYVNSKKTYFLKPYFNLKENYSIDCEIRSVEKSVKIVSSERSPVKNNDNKSNKSKSKISNSSLLEAERQKRKELEIEIEKYKKLLKKEKRGIQPVTKKEKIIDANNFNFYALVIGINDYKFLDNLKTPLNDVNEISKILRNKFNFNVTNLINPTKNKITLELSKLSNVMQVNDSLLIYYAGHGNMKENDGYWMARDADPKLSSTWISNDLISRELKYNKATNILVIADSCYSGTLTRGKSDITLKPSQKVLKSFMKTRSRMVISSGGLFPVLDGGGGQHSVFASSILVELKKIKTPTTSSELYTSIVQKVTKLSQNLGLEQKPMLSSIVKSIHNGPDFVFLPN